MKIINKQLIVGGSQIGTFKAFDDIDTELIAQMPGERVLPAQHMFEKGTFFTLVKRHNPGEKRSFPNGGFEIREQNCGGLFNYDLDQVIKYPETNYQKRIVKQLTTDGEFITNGKGRPAKLNIKTTDDIKRGKGRPPMDPELKAAKLAEKEERTKISSGKRGRPRSIEPKIIKQYTPTGNKRGRKPLDEAEKTKRIIEKSLQRIKSGGKKGRPRKNK